MLNISYKYLLTSLLTEGRNVATIIKKKERGQKVGLSM